MQSLQCRFAKRGCAHSDELFKPAYQRVNRARGTKILRCFPHCCPAHIPRSYCGSTIELRVKAAPGLEGDRLLVFARFRLRDEPAELRVGDHLALAAITYGVQSPSNTKAPWIQSRRRPASEEDDRQHGNASFAFEINPGRRWYYSWHSSKNSATRTTKHVLEAFVFLRDGDSVRCVATLTSPSFTLVSFRRVTASETALIGEELKAVPREPVAAREPLRASLRVLVKDATIDKSSPATRQRHESRQPTFTSHLDPVGVLFRAAQQYPMGEAGRLVSTWMRMAEQHTSTALSHMGSQRVALKDEAQLAAHVVGWLMLDATTQAAWRDHTRRGARVLVNKSELRACFDRWTRWLASHVECLLATLEQPPLQELASRLLPVGYDASHDTAYYFGWNSFVAQAREVFMGVAVPTHESTVRAQRPWSCPLECVSVAAVTDSTELLDDSTSQQAIRRLPVTTLFAFWQQLSRVHIDLNTASSPNELVVSSHGDDKSPAMRLLLDNRPRRCHALPHGEATLGAGAALLHGFGGDYIATQLRDGTIEVNLFLWPVGSETDAVRLRWTFATRDLAAERLDIHLVVSVSELQGLPDLPTATTREKLACVGRWRDAYKAHMLYTREL